MRVLITGVAGFIGSNLAKRLLAEGHDVVGIDNLSYGRISNIEPLLENKNFTFLLRDLTSPIDDVECEMVVHLASQKIPRYSTGLRTLEENNAMLKNVVNKCLAAKIKLVFSSTSDVYGKNNSLPFSEQSNLVIGETTVKRWAYAVSKIYSEHFITANHEEHGLEYTIMRFFGSYGPNQNTTWWGGPQAVFIQNILEGKPIEIHGNGLQTRTFTYVDDTVDGIVKCMFSENARNQIFNIAGRPNEEISINELARLICRLMATDAKIQYIPYSTFGKYEDVQRRVPDIEKIKNILGFNPSYSIEEGLTKTIKWQIDAQDNLR